MISPSPEQAEINALRRGLRLAFESEAAVLASRYRILAKLRGARTELVEERARVLDLEAECARLVARVEVLDEQLAKANEAVEDKKSDEALLRIENEKLAAKVAELTAQLIAPPPFATSGTFVVTPDGPKAAPDVSSAT